MLPPPLAALVQAAFDARSPENDVPARYARRHGGIPLYGDMGGVLLLRPDGTIWEILLDADVATPVTADQRAHALATGIRRYPWLAELLPKIPAGATLCTDCHGEGELQLGTARPFCGGCHALGWRPAKQSP